MLPFRCYDEDPAGSRWINTPLRIDTHAVGNAWSFVTPQLLLLGLIYDGGVQPHSSRYVSYDQ
jgi:hypothetical protein